MVASIRLNNFLQALIITIALFLMDKKSNSRRAFLKASAILGAVATVAPHSAEAMFQDRSNTNKDGLTFLFQGDSITDGGRSRNKDWNHVMGHGYAYIIASRLWFDYPKRGFHFFNRGISGNKVNDLAVRWQQDTLDLKPDILSILVGINDVAAWINGDKQYAAGEYENGYRALLQQTRQQLPNVKFVLCGPFILPVDRVKEKWNEYFAGVEQRRQIVKRLAAEYSAVHIELQEAFNHALSKAPAEYWIWDGVHPMPAGHELIARKWIHEVSKKLKVI